MSTFLTEHAAILATMPRDERGYLLTPASVHLRAARAIGWKRAIDIASALGRVETIWAAAMTAQYGPTGLHASYADEDGIPTAEALARFPDVARRMERAAADFDRWVDQLEGEERRSDRGPAGDYWRAQDRAMAWVDARAGEMMDAE